MECCSRSTGVLLKKLTVLLLSVTVLGFAQAPAFHGTSARHPYLVSAKPSKELARLIKKLRAQKARVALTTERVEQPFFSPSALIVNINDQAVQVFEYSHVAEADKEAKLVSADGMTIGGIKPFWIAPPHFFKGGRLIVIYVGNDSVILKLLHRVLGGQFAGVR